MLPRTPRQDTSTLEAGSTLYCVTFAELLIRLTVQSKGCRRPNLANYYAAMLKASPWTAVPLAIRPMLHVNCRGPGSSCAKLC